jgi:O-antigen ligase
VVMIALAIGLTGKRLLDSSAANLSLFPTGSLLAAWLLTVPCVVFSQYPLLSLLIFVLNFAVYAFFLYALEELRREGGFERLVLLLSIVLLVMAAGLVFDHILQVNLSLRGSNVNQLTYAAGLEIYRAGGFFQDPQKSGAFLACMITFLLLLAVRGRFRGIGMRLVVWVAIAASLIALVTTVSRAAILACLTISGLTVFVFNKWSAPAKLVSIGGMILIASAIALAPHDTWLDIVPTAVTKRIATLHEDIEIRLKIWFDTWNMFADHPLTGIGLGSFQLYLIETRPTVFNYYGLGAATGVVYVPDQPESGYLKILYEGGLAGSAAALLLVGDALRRAMLVIAGKNTDSDARSEAIAALAGLAVFGATFVTLFTATDGRIAALFAFLLAVIWHRSLQGTQRSPKA